MAKLPPALAKKPVEGKRISVETHAGERREQILALVTKVFAKRGYQGATIDHLVAGGKTSMGGFYKFFEGKEDCFVQVFDRAADRAQARAIAGGKGADGVIEGYAGGLRGLLEFIAEEPFSARVVLLEAQSGGPTAVGRYNELLGEAATVLRRAREGSKAAADLPESFEEASISGVAWLLQNRLARGESVDADELYPQLAKILFEPYLDRRGLERLVAAQTPSAG